MNSKATVLIADDHAAFRSLLREVIEAEPNFKVIGEASDGKTTFEQLLRFKPRMLILDIDMPLLDGMKTIRMICEQVFPVDVLVLTLYEEEQIFNAAMDSGAKAYVLKQSAANDIPVALERVVSGQTFVSNSMLEIARGRDERVRKAPLAKSQIECLTQAERRVLKLICEACTSKEIAERLKLSVNAVEHYRYQICRKLDLAGHHLFEIAFKNGATVE